MEEPNFQIPDSTEVSKIELRLDDSFLDATSKKIQSYRPTRDLTAEWTNEGPPTQDVADVVDFWSTEYDWRSIEQKMNADFQHYATTVNGSGNYSHSIPLHFVHHRSSHEDAIPLVLLHGWPSSFLEWSQVMRPLLEHQDQSFHVVAPDLPGFGFSPATKGPGLGPREIGAAVDELMHRLGYNRYGIVSTDLGWLVGMWMAQDLQDHIIGHMCDFFITRPTPNDLARLENGSTNSDEAGYMASANSWFGEHAAFSTVHCQKPLALSYALGDSPVGLLAWLMDVTYGSNGGRKHDFERIITDTMMMWIPGPYANIRSYLEFFKPHLLHFTKTSVPTGLSQWGWGIQPFPELARFPFAPREWVERSVNLVFFKRHEVGGHFPAIDQPDLWVQDVREFFVNLEKASQPGI